MQTVRYLYPIIRMWMRFFLLKLQGSILRTWLARIVMRFSITETEQFLIMQMNLLLCLN